MRFCIRLELGMFGACNYVRVPLRMMWHLGNFLSLEFTLSPVQVLDAGKVDYRDCLERNELVERLKDTKNFITPAAQQLLQRILCGEDDEELSASLLQEVPNLVEGTNL